MPLMPPNAALVWKAVIRVFLVHPSLESVLPVPELFHPLLLAAKPDTSLSAVSHIAIHFTQTLSRKIILCLHYRQYP